jgi:microcystin-dependent protein
VVGAVTGNFSTVNVSTLNAPNFAISTVNTSTVNSVFSDTKVSLTSTLSLFGNVNVDLGLGNQIAGLVGGAAGQALGVGIGGAGLITGAAALITGRTSGGVNSNVFQTINGSTQLQFSTIGAPTNSVFLTTNSLNPLTTPGLEISTTISVPAGTYCVRSVGDPLYINNNVSSIQMFGQWVPVIQPTATIGAVAVSSLGVSSINGAAYPPPGGGGIPSTLAASSITVNGALTQSGLGTFNWGGNTMSLTQVVLARPTAVNNTLTTTGAAFLNAGATVNSGLTVASGGANFTGNVTVNNSLFVFQILQGQTIQATGSLSVGGGGVSIVGGGINMAAGNLTMTNATSVANFTNVNVNNTLVVSQSARANAISTNQISTNNINVNTINNAPYPPGGGGGSIPSTLNASTVFVNGGQTMTNAPLTFFDTALNRTNGNFIANSGTLQIAIPEVGSPGGSAFTITAGSTLASTLMFLAPTGRVRFTSSMTVRDPVPVGTPSQAYITTYTIGSEAPAGSVITSNISTNNINLNTINGAPYSPGGGSIPSTLNASTLNVNGGQTISNGGLTISGGGTISDGGKWRYRMANVASAVSFEQAAGNNDSIILDLNANKTARFYSTLLVRDSTWPSPQPSGAAIRTYDTNDPAPYGSIITSNVSTFRINSQFATLSTISTSFISSGTITASNIGCFQFSSLSGSINTLLTSNLTVGSNANIGSLFVTSNALMGSISTNAISTSGILASAGNIAQLAVSSINGNIYPPPTPPLVPVGSITIWAGGSDNGSVQTFNVPTGWLLCDGAGYDRTVYSNLFGVIGTKYGLNKPNTGLNFYVPDLTFAVPMGTPYRNYTSTIFSPSPFQVYVQSWLSDFAPTPTPSAKTWKINQTVGGTLNYGTMFPASGFPISGFPTLYVSQILSYDGYQGYIVVKSVNGAAIPDIPGGNQIIVQADGTVPQDASGTYLYTLGSYGVNSGYPQVTRNQKAAEVGAHTHTFRNTAFFGSTGLADGTLQPGKGVDTNAQTGSNQLSTISTVGATNIGTYTAPNFINMLYIIKF